MTAILGHLLAGYAVAAPWLARLRSAGATESADSQAVARVRRYRRVLAAQVGVTAAVCALWLFGGVDGARLGLRAPHSWAVSGPLAAVIIALLAWSTLRLRRQAARSAGEPSQGAGMLPESRRDRRWFAALGIGGAVSEELLFRGFLFYYLATWLPAANDLEKALLTSAAFAAGHGYRNWQGVAASAAAGLVLAALYVASGSLLLPIVVHAVANLRGLLIDSDREETRAPV